MADSFQTIHPPTGEPIHSYQHFDAQTVENSISWASERFHSFKTKSIASKAEDLKHLASELRAEKNSLARLITLEMGKAIQDSEAEIEKCAMTCEYFADRLPAFLAPQESPSHYAKSKVVKESLGPILTIMPWNFPIWQVMRFAAPALGIGNPILLKHSDLTAGTAEKLGEIFDRVERGLLINLRIDHKQAARVIADKRVRGVTLTGSTRAGKEIASESGKHLKKTVLELGGSDAYVVLKDADLKAAARTCALARMTNNGQSCIAAKRFLVDQSVFAEFLKFFEMAMKEVRMGDPFVRETQVGSLASKKFQKQLLEQCAFLEKAGGEKIFDLDSRFDFSHPGAFFPARAYKVTAEQDMAFEDEFFGPVALMWSFQSEKEALALCNRSVYGLGGAVFSKDEKRAEEFARGMEAGFITINDQVKSDPRLPFGGVKESGYGRELGLYGFNEFCNIKSLGFGSVEKKSEAAQSE
ncbi:MAG: aldehyde dehydrogenase family protein [Pseudobdellovibrionaceae bacterium]